MKRERVLGMADRVTVLQTQFSGWMTVEGKDVDWLDVCLAGKTHVFVQTRPSETCLCSGKDSSRKMSTCQTCGQDALATCVQFAAAGRK